jgi:hypothetical protein
VIVGYEQARRYGQLVEKLTGDEEIVPPGLILELDRPEWLALAGTRLWSTGPVSVAGAVGNFGRIQIQNPAAAKQGFPALIVVVLGARAVGAAVAQFDISTDDAIIVAGVTSNLALDTRVSGDVSGIRRVASKNAVANNLPATGGNILDRFNNDTNRSEARSPLIDSRPIILKPNTNMSLTQRLANTALQGVIWGYERIARQEELEDA